MGGTVVWKEGGWEGGREGGWVGGREGGPLHLILSCITNAFFNVERVYQLYLISKSCNMA